MIKKEWCWMLDNDKSIIKEKNLSDSDVWITFVNTIMNCGVLRIRI